MVYSSEFKIYKQQSKSFLFLLKLVYSTLQLLKRLNYKSYADVEMRLNSEFISFTVLRGSVRIRGWNLRTNG